DGEEVKGREVCRRLGRRWFLAVRSWSGSAGYVSGTTVNSDNAIGHLTFLVVSEGVGTCGSYALWVLCSAPQSGAEHRTRPALWRLLHSRPRVQPWRAGGRRCLPVVSGFC